MCIYRYIRILIVNYVCWLATIKNYELVILLINLKQGSLKCHHIANSSKGLNQEFISQICVPSSLSQKNIDIEVETSGVAKVSRKGHDRHSVGVAKHLAYMPLLACLLHWLTSNQESSHSCTVDGTC